MINFLFFQALLSSSSMPTLSVASFRNEIQTLDSTCNISDPMDIEEYEFERDGAGGFIYAIYDDKVKMYSSWLF